MANSLRAKLSKLRHDGNITDTEYQALIKKLDGHDTENRAKAIDEFYNKVLNFEDYIDPVDESNLGSGLLYSEKDITNMIVKIAEEMRGAE